MTTSVDLPVAIRESELDWVDIGVRPGYKQKYQGFFDRDAELAVRVGSLYAEPYYHSPRHRHTFQQIRFVVSGKMRYGNEMYRPGDCLYIPEGAAYGPVKPLEDASPDTELLHFVDMQFQGPSGIPYPDPDEVVRTREALSEVGTFEEGIYTDASGKKHDAYEAILAKLMGTETVEYPESLFADYVVMRSSKFAWTPLPEIDGAQIKHLGHFTESGPNVKLVSLPPGATVPRSTAPAHLVRFVLSGGVQYEDEAYEPISFTMFPRGFDYGPMEATRETQLLVVQWLSGLRDGDAPIAYHWPSV